MEASSINESVLTEDKFWEQILYMKSLTLTTGSLCEGQIHQLRGFIVLVFENFKKIEILYNHEYSTLTYLVTSGKGSIPEELDKKMDRISEFVRKVLWDKITIKVSYKNKIVYENLGKAETKK